MAEVDIDLEGLGKSVKLEVKILHVNRFTWRLRITRWLLQLAELISPIKLVLHDSIYSVWLFHCQHCGREFFDYYIPGTGYYVLSCPYCEYQMLAHAGVAGTYLVKPEAFVGCNNNCGYQEPYGFVPEADCPTHDKRN